MLNIKEKSIILCISIFLLIVTASIPVIAFDVNEALGDLENYGTVAGNSTIFEEKARTLIGIVQIFGSLCAIICLIILGVKYMTGSIEEKAQYKKTLMPYFIGAMMVFGISNFLVVIYNVAIAIF